MKVIISRKGFDSSSSGYPSPILEDGTLLSLPIPDPDSLVSYHHLTSREKNYFDYMKSINNTIKLKNNWKELDETITCHLDPDLDANTLKREKGWKGVFGQSGAAQRHLENQGVEEGDLFLFFGWFRNTIVKGDRILFDPQDKKGRHIIYGYLQIGEIHKVDSAFNIPKWMSDHPHVTPQKREKERNTIYVARDSLNWCENTPGYGTFNFHERRVLTKQGMNKSCWDLPDIFKDRSISYHKPSSWKEGYFQSVARGQEFVVESDESVLQWAKELIHT
ncbi:hypothetical protein [Pseudalkalibacillus sp. SCS-8]|uniref:Nmad3 family putative nucleotide modification protein n=1 Tax=Pseudalkalibacillus nanhaiensis TaxID=3115291 RepID=UPI0032D9DB4F